MSQYLAQTLMNQLCSQTKVMAFADEIKTAALIINVIINNNNNNINITSIKALVQQV